MTWHSTHLQVQIEGTYTEPDSYEYEDIMKVTKGLPNIPWLILAPLGEGEPNLLGQTTD